FFDDVTPLSQTQVSSNFNLPWYKVELELPSAVTLEGGADGTKYWVGLFVTQGASGANLNFWEVKTNGTTAFTHTSEDQGVTWIPSQSAYDGVFELIGECSGEIIITDEYCQVTVTTEVQPITRILFASIDNTSSPDPSAAAHEYFLDILGNVEKGGNYEITVEGSTNGNFTNYFTAFIDWNQNSILDDTGEVYEIGTITNSTGA